MATLAMRKNGYHSLLQLKILPWRLGKTAIIGH